MLDKNVTVGKTSQSFVNPRKHNQSANAPRPQVPLGSDPMKRQYNTTTKFVFKLTDVLPRQNIVPNQGID